MNFKFILIAILYVIKKNKQNFYLQYLEIFLRALKAQSELIP